MLYERLVTQFPTSVRYWRLYIEQEVNSHSHFPPPPPRSNLQSQRTHINFRPLSACLVLVAGAGTLMCAGHNMYLSVRMYALVCMYWRNELHETLAEDIS